MAGSGENVSGLGKRKHRSCNSSSVNADEALANVSPDMPCQDTLEWGRTGIIRSGGSANANKAPMNDRDIAYLKWGKTRRRSRATANEARVDIDIPDLNDTVLTPTVTPVGVQEDHGHAEVVHPDNGSVTSGCSPMRVYEVVSQFDDTKRGLVMSTGFAEQLLNNKYSEGGMTEAQQESFKVAFVVFAMSCLLAPTTRHGFEDVDYLHALVDPEKISSFDWASYVIHHLVAASSEVKFHLWKERTVPNMIGGCMLFLQIFCLDNMEFRELNLPHDTFPRVKVYDSERMSVTP
uniref:Aminotransferase-like plant mobile domain-containing protein n=1 Tax=Oryza punctata TaxID=4537 RepID=A0A0E0LI82_ORYPU